MPSHTPPAPPSSLTDDLRIIEPLCAVFRRALKGEGLKYTPERAQILDIIVRHEGLFEADEVLTQVKSSGFRVSKATVYRTLRLLLDAGIIRRVLLSDEHASYQLAYGRHPNDLLVIVDSGQVIPVDIPELNVICERLARERNLTLTGHNLQVFALRKP